MNRGEPGARRELTLADPWSAARASVRIVSKPDVEVRRSQRRHRTVSAYRDGGRVVVLIPDQFTRAEEREWVDKMLDRLAAAGRPRAAHRRRADRPRRCAWPHRYLPDHPAASHPASVRWVANQNGRWGSCTPADGTIRISDRIADMPEWVVDYVVLHELVHLVVPATTPSSGRWSAAIRRPSAPAATSKGSPRSPAPRSTRIDA